MKLKADNRLMKLKADNRLELAWTPNKFRKTDLKTEFRNSLENDIDIWLKKPQLVTKLGKHNDVSLFEVKESDVRSYHATHPNSLFPVGSLYCVKEKGRWHSEMVLVLPEYQGMGIGPAMYVLAIETLGHLASSADLSVGSSKLWQMLIKKYKGWFVIPASESLTGKETKVEIVGWKTNGETYPVFKAQDGSEVTLDSLLRKGVGKRAAASGYYLVEK